MQNHKSWSRLLLAALLSGGALPARAVPHIEFSGAGLLSFLLLVLLFLFGIPVAVGLLVRAWLLRGQPAPRPGFYRPLAFATVAWLGTGFLVRLLATDLEASAAGLLLPVGLALLAAVGAALGGVRLDQAERAAAGPPPAEPRQARRQSF